MIFVGYFLHCLILNTDDPILDCVNLFTCLSLMHQQVISLIHHLLNIMISSSFKLFHVLGCNRGRVLFACCTHVGKRLAGEEPGATASVLLCITIYSAQCLQLKIAKNYKKHADLKSIKIPSLDPFN